MKLEKTTYKSTHERLEAEGFSPEQQLEVRSRIRIIYFPLTPNRGFRLLCVFKDRNAT